MKKPCSRLLRMRVLVLFMLWVAMPVLARAQAATANSQPKPVVAAAPAPPDTVAALHRLFASERRARYAGASFFAVLGIGATVAYAAPNNGVQANASFLPIAITGIFGSVGLAANSRRYSRRHEQQAIEAYQAHHLPPDIRQKLRPFLRF